MKLKLKLFMIVMLLANIQLFAQDITVSGTVIDVNGMPIAGANVLVAGTATFTGGPAHYAENISRIRNASL